VIGAIRVMIVDDHTMFREVLVHFLNTQGDIEVVQDVPNGREAVLVVGEVKPDVLLLDLVMPEMDGLEVLRKVRQKSPGTKVLVLTGYFDEGLVLRALGEGARGYLLKSGKTGDLVKAIKAVYTGEAWVERSMIGKLLNGLPRSNQGQIDKGKRRERAKPLLTKREEEVARLVAMGYRNKEIADRLSISEKTVKSHLTSILRKLNVSHRLQVVLRMLHHGFILHQPPRE